MFGSLLLGEGKQRVILLVTFIDFEAIRKGPTTENLPYRRERMTEYRMVDY